MKKHKKELILILAILAAAAVGFFINYQNSRRPAVLVEVSVDGAAIASYDLNENLDTIIDGYQGGTNHLIIQDGAAWISEATCPDKVCIHQGRITMNGELLVCLPNRVIVPSPNSGHIDSHTVFYIRNTYSGSERAKKTSAWI
jgi:hypothetical protein